MRIQDLSERGNDAWFLVGPTAVGKTSVAQWIAERHGFEILSADSMLVYRGMDVGTAKPSEAERRKVRYWGIDLVPIGSPFNVARYLDEARACFANARTNATGVIVVGGTGLYVKALIEGLAPLPDTTEAAGRKWAGVLERVGVEALREELRQRAPAWLEQLPDPRNGRRLVRALELVEAGLRVPPRTWSETSLARLVGLTMDRELLKLRIATRVEAMYDAGLLDEVRRLVADGLLDSPTASQAIGYAEAGACLDGQVSRAEAVRRTAQRTNQLAKRQMTWFRGQATVRWIEVAPADPIESTAAKVMAAWEEAGATHVAV